MPPVTIWSLRASLGWFVVGLTIGTLLLIDKGVGTLSMSPGWLHVHMHMLLFGWLVQTIFAVAYWMLPRFGRDRPRSWLAIVAIVLMNIAAVVAVAYAWTPVHRVLALVELVAIVAFVVHAWPRIKSFGA